MTLIALGVAAAGAGAALGGIGFSHADGDQTGDLDHYRSSIATINAELGAGVALAGLGVASIAAGAVLALRARAARRDRPVSITVAPSLGGLVAAGSF